MATLIDSMIERAKADKKTIVLPEGNDDRILKAAETALAEGILIGVLAWGSVVTFTVFGNN